jgi:capsular exopolysaccharide synthesis family protein
MAQHALEMETEVLESTHTHVSVNLVQLVWRRKALIVLGGVIGLAAAWLYYSRLTPTYQASAQVQVMNKYPNALPVQGLDTRLSFFEDYTANHLKLISSPLLISKAVEKKQLHTLKSFAGKGDPTGAICGAFSASRETKDGTATNVLILSFRGTDPDDCGAVLAAIIDTYKEYLDVKTRNVSSDTVKLITEARDVLENKLTKKDQEYRKFRLENPLLIKNKEGNNVHQDRLFSLEQRKLALLDRQAELLERVSILEAAIREGRSRAELLALIDEPANRVSAEEPKKGTKPEPEETLTALLLQEQMLLEDYAEEHPQVRAVRKKIEFLTARGNARANPPGTDPVQAHLQSLKRELEAVKASEQLLVKLSAAEQDEARKLMRYELQDESLRNDLTRTQQLFDNVRQRLAEVDLVKNLGGFDAETLSPPGRGWRVGPQPFPIFGMGLFLGLAGGLGLAYLAEVSDKSFRNPEEIRRWLGLPVVGHIQHLQAGEESEEADAGGLALDPLLCTYYRPRSREAEAYRGVRTALFFDARGGGHKVIQITSPDMADGKSTLAANLAVSIAQSGKTIVLIDADFRRPRLHKMFGLSPKAGLASVIAGEAELPDAIQPSGIPGLAILPCGPIPPNPAELLTLPRFEELLKLIKEQYDFVVIDTPPLLAVTDPSVVAPRVDGVLLTIRVSKNGKPHAMRAKEILTNLGARVLGVVVNGVGTDGAAGYGHYHYGEGYGRSYGYYQSDGSDGYYPEQDGVPAAQAPEGGAPAAADGNGEPRHKPRAKGRPQKANPGFLKRLFGG